MNLRRRGWQEALVGLGKVPPLPVSLSPQKTVGRGRYIFYFSIRFKDSTIQCANLSVNTLHDEVAAT